MKRKEFLLLAISQLTEEECQKVYNYINESFTESTDKRSDSELPDVSGSLPLTDAIIIEAREILNMKYITKLDQTPKWMAKQKRILTFTKTLAEMIVAITPKVKTL